LPLLSLQAASHTNESAQAKKGRRTARRLASIRCRTPLP